LRCAFAAAALCVKKRLLLCVRARRNETDYTTNALVVIGIGC
jgi:hypothetical protein